MTAATLALYARTVANAPAHAVPAAPFERARIRDALGYRPWSPSVRAPVLAPVAVPVSPAARAGGPMPLGTRVAVAALALRRTAVGRALHRVTPQALLDALKARLNS